MKRFLFLTAFLACGYSASLYAQGIRLRAKDPACKEIIAKCTSKVKEWQASYKAASREGKLQLLDISSAVNQGCNECLKTFDWYDNENHRWEGCGRIQQDVCRVY